MSSLIISIITVVYNSEKTIKKTCESINSQSYKNFEHIIIDGKSNDNSLSIVNEFSHKKKIISEIDNGVYDAMNKGIKNANGDIIGFLNSDDFYANNNVLYKISNLFQNNPIIDACYSDLIYTDKKDIAKNIRIWKSNKFIPGLFSKGWCPPHPTFFVRRSVYENFGTFNLKYNISSDVELMMRFLEVNKINVCYVPEVWVKMRMGGLSNKNFKNIIKQNQEVLLAMKSNGLHFNFFVFLFHKVISRLKQFLFVNPN